jgi:alpha-beta hydrolase superfamily lysophospholipase
MRGRVSWSVAPVLGATGTVSPVWFGSSQRPLFGWIHSPADGTARAAALLCPPLGRESIVAHYTYRRLAQELARRGLLAVRFDYDGTGDSMGDDEDPNRVNAWQESIVHAADLTVQCGAPSLVLIGMRMGALLAASVTKATGATAFVAWDPCRSGRAFVREQNAGQRIHFGDLSPVTDGVELPGFVYSSETVADLGRLKLAIRGSCVTKALVLTRVSARVPDVLAEELSECDLDVDQAEGQEQLLEVDPIHQKIPLVAIERIVEWVAQSATEEEVTVAVPPSTLTRLGVLDGSAVAERALSIGSSGLFGIETTDSKRSHGPSVIFVTSSFDSHVGPNRLWVLLARSWAAAGMRCIRLDVSGIGDSPARDGSSEHVLMSPDAFDDLADAARALCPSDPSDVIWVGLCSGGYQALEAAFSLRAKGVCVVNPALRFYPPELEDGPIDPRRHFCHPPSAIFLIVRRYSKWALSKGKAARPIWGRILSGARRVRSSWGNAVSESNACTLFILGEEDASEIGISESESFQIDRLQVEILPGLDHALMPARQRIDVMEMMTRYVIDHFPEQVPDHSTRHHPA